jgi:hypothetical protein
LDFRTREGEKAWKNDSKISILRKWPYLLQVYSSLTSYLPSTHIDSCSAQNTGIIVRGLEVIFWWE